MNNSIGIEVLGTNFELEWSLGTEKWTMGKFSCKWFMNNKGLGDIRTLFNTDKGYFDT